MGAIFDLSGLAATVRSFAIVTDTVWVELRRAEDSSVAFSQGFPENLLTTLTGAVVVQAAVPLKVSPEQFFLHVDVRNGSTVYYTADATVTVVAGVGVTTARLVPTYVGPGGGADSLAFLLPPLLLAGDSLLAVARVFEAGNLLAGVPVSYTSADPSRVRVRPGLLGTAWLIADRAAAGTVSITAATPGGLSQSAQLTVLAAPAILERVSGDGQQLLLGALSAPLVVRVLDGNGLPFTGGVPVNFGLTGPIPLGTQLTESRVVSDGQGLAQTRLVGGTLPGLAEVTATGEGLTTAPVKFLLTLLNPL